MRASARLVRARAIFVRVSARFVRARGPLTFTPVVFLVVFSFCIFFPPTQESTSIYRRSQFRASISPRVPAFGEITRIGIARLRIERAKLRGAHGLASSFQSLGLVGKRCASRSTRQGSRQGEVSRGVERAHFRLFFESNIIHYLPENKSFAPRDDTSSEKGNAFFSLSLSLSHRS